MIIERELYVTDYRIDDSQSRRDRYDLTRKVLDEFYTRYHIQIPDSLSWIIEDDVRESNITFICQGCATAIKADWIYIEAMSVRTRGVPATEQAETQRVSSEIYATFPNYCQEKFQEMLGYYSLETCPICGTKLTKRFPWIRSGCDYQYLDIPYTHELNFTDSLSWWEDFEASVPQVNQAIWDHVDEGFDDVFVQPCLDAHAAFLQRCDVPSSVMRPKTEISTDLLKEYLNHIINLETNVLCMSRRLRELYLLRGEATIDATYEQGISALDLTKKAEQKSAALVALKREAEELESRPAAYESIAYPIEPEKPHLIKATLFNKKKAEELNARSTEAYESAMKMYALAVEQWEKSKAIAQQRKEEQLKAYRERIDIETRVLVQIQDEAAQIKTDASGVPTTASGRLHVLNAEIATTEEALRKNIQCRNELYGYNVVFGKYRNLVAISSFYEYLMSGRCETLEGTNGAYNIYENESRLDSILTKLDEIETKLDDIKSTQFMVYSKLSSIELSLNTLNRSMSKAISALDSINANTASMSRYLENISNNTDVIAHNTAVSAYYSKVTAELTNALGFMEALN